MNVSSAKLKKTPCMFCQGKQELVVGAMIRDHSIEQPTDGTSIFAGQSSPPTMYCRNCHITITVWEVTISDYQKWMNREAKKWAKRLQKQYGSKK